MSKLSMDERRLRVLLYNAIDFMLQSSVGEKEIKEYIGASDEEMNEIYYEQFGGEI